MLALYNKYFPEFCGEKKYIAQVGFEPTTFAL